MNTDIIVAILTSSVVGALVTRIFTLIDQYRHSRKIDRIVLLFIVKQLSTDAIWNKYISSEDLQSLEDAYAEYKQLGGNGYADTLMNRARVLPIKED